ncbi:PE domain-containing protein, partial [Actinokineospora sp.]|uniref:PE domain-containing protein n=1 Tax=Actinokineospora sp. TaxID=1872133 RepID=UPI003D6B4439
EQQVNTHIFVEKARTWIGDLFGDANATTTGGGGAGGGYHWTDPTELQAVITQWESIRDEIDEDLHAIQSAISLAQAPADDEMSTAQAEATRTSLGKCAEHNQAMYEYANSYVNKLKAARGDTITTDESNASTLNRNGGI